MSGRGAAGDTPGDEPRVAFPLWGVGAAVFGWGLLRGRVLLMAIGAAAFFADSEAEPVRRVREALGARRDTR